MRLQPEKPGNFLPALLENMGRWKVRSLWTGYRRRAAKIMRRGPPCVRGARWGEFRWTSYTCWDSIGTTTFGCAATMISETDRREMHPLGRNFILSNSGIDKVLYNNGIFLAKVGPFLDRGISGTHRSSSARRNGSRTPACRSRSKCLEILNSCLAMARTYAPETIHFIQPCPNDRSGRRRARSGRRRGIECFLEHSGLRSSCLKFVRSKSIWTLSTPVWRRTAGTLCLLYTSIVWLL